MVLLLVAFTDPSPIWILTVLGLTGWMGVARLVSAEKCVPASSGGLCARRTITRFRSEARILLPPCTAVDRRPD